MYSYVRLAMLFDPGGNRLGLAISSFAIVACGDFQHIGFRIYSYEAVLPNPFGKRLACSPAYA